MIPYFSMATTALGRNPMRTFLTVLGIVIGILLLVMVFSLGQATQEVVTGELEMYGANTIYTEIKAPGLSDASPSNTTFIEGLSITTLKESDVEAMFQIPEVTNAYAAVMGYEAVTSLYGEQRYTTYGTSAAYVDVDPMEVAEGRFFTESEDKGLQRVVVLGSSAAEELFPGMDPLGQSVRIQGLPFKVIGVAKPQGIVFFQNMDDVIFIPLHAAQKLVLGIEHVQFFVVMMEDEKQADSVKAEMIKILAERHETPTPDKYDFHVMTMEEGLEVLGTVTNALQILLTFLALISLVVGGVGVMNVMIVSVTERTREIGLRKAMGASPRMILLQFLMEAVLLTAAGGLLGIGLGTGLSYTATALAEYLEMDLRFHVPLFAMGLGFGAALFEGLIFGLYPASKAARLHPIEALRKE
jgi:putative ABC transport system permease protein